MMSKSIEYSPIYGALNVEPIIGTDHIIPSEVLKNIRDWATGINDPEGMEYNVLCLNMNKDEAGRVHWDIFVNTPYYADINSEEGAPALEVGDVVIISRARLNELEALEEKKPAAKKTTTKEPK